MKQYSYCYSVINIKNGITLQIDCGKVNKVKINIEEKGSAGESISFCIIKLYKKGFVMMVND